MDRPVEILFVDDNEAHARILREALAAPGVVPHRVRVAATGRDALDRLLGAGSHGGAPRPDLVLLDLHLPVVTGVDVIDALKRDPELRAIPVVVLTRSPRPEEVAECYARGANSVVTRPTRLDALAETLRDVVRYWAEVNQLHPGGRAGDG
jgi:CheY-like chemotaxis protein